jgi:hypothetical protein
MKLFIRESNIDESAQDELYRIAENELLPETELYKISEYCTIDEDTFDFTQTGTAWGGYICYDIYMEWTAEYLPKIEKFYKHYTDDDDYPIHRDWRLDEIKIYFNIHVEGDKVTVDIADTDIVDDHNFDKVFDLDALCDAIKEIAEKSANYIHSKIGGYYEYDDMDESIRKRSRKRSSCLKESVSEKFEMQSLANDLNKINDDKSWVGIDASLYKDSNGHWRVKVNILNTNYETVMDSCDVVVSNRGGYVIHLYNPTASQWYDTKDDVLYYFERRVKSNKK